MIWQGGMRHVFWSESGAGPEALESRGKVPAAAAAALAGALLDSRAAPGARGSPGACRPTGRGACLRGSRRRPAWCGPPDVDRSRAEISPGFAWLFAFLYLWLAPRSASLMGRSFPVTFPHPRLPSAGAQSPVCL